jgi:hypothetical protein
MTPSIVGPDVPPSSVTFTDEQLREIYDRIELIDQHFERCCGFQRDYCTYGGEYNKMYDMLHLAGLEEWRTPFDRRALRVVAR